VVLCLLYLGYEWSFSVKHCRCSGYFGCRVLFSSKIRFRSIGVSLVQFSNLNSNFISMIFVVKICIKISLRLFRYGRVLELFEYPANGNTRCSTSSTIYADAISVVLNSNQI